MAETDPPPSTTPPEQSADDDAGRPRCGGGILRLFRQIREAGRDVAALARGRPLDTWPTSDEPQTAAEDSSKAHEPADWRVKVLHGAAEKLRGAADSYIAAKLDEIEARVDNKLDRVEQRIDAKIVELHRNLRELRDRELRHRLRMLKITLIFTVLVALLSLGYKWLSHYVLG